VWRTRPNCPGCSNWSINSPADGADILTRLLSSGTLLLDPPWLTVDIAALFV
jgi:hypothetical protein